MVNEMRLSVVTGDNWNHLRFPSSSLSAAAAVAVASVT